MSHLPDPSPAVSPSPSADDLPTAALLLAALPVLRRLKLPCPTAQQVLDATGAGRTRAYELMRELLGLLPGLLRPPGRPPAPPAPPADIEPLARRMLTYVMQHPGCVHQGPKRQHYDDRLRAFVLDLRAEHPHLSLEDFARAVCIPSPTLKHWTRQPSRPATEATPPPPAQDVAVARIQTVLDAWRSWDGSFSTFCKHVREHLRIPHGDTWISGVLFRHGERTPQRRKGRSPDEKALRQSFETFFPGAQWTGDGTALSICIDEQVFTFNLELDVDTHTAALVGACISDEEDSAAVAEAYHDGVATTGAAPIALLLDNKQSNQTDEVDAALGDTMRIQATQGRAQNKAHTEGAFGLFQQTAPPLRFDTTDPKTLAKDILACVTQTWARVLNHKPRPAHGGRSRVEQYGEDTPTDEQIDHANTHLRELWRRQQRAQRTRQARLDPIVRLRLDAAFARLGLDDPHGNVKDAIATFPLDAVLAGIATFEAKMQRGTLPDGVGPRYLLGIVRNIAQQDEGRTISSLLWQERLAARDAMLLELERTRDADAGSHPYTPALLDTTVEHALDADRHIDHVFWLDTAADIIRDAPTEERGSLFDRATRRIHAAFRLPYARRLAATRHIADRVVPLGIPPLVDATPTATSSASPYLA